MEVLVTIVAVLAGAALGLLIMCSLAACMLSSQISREEEDRGF